MYKFLRVDMKSGRTELVDIPAEYQGLGGRALTSAVVSREVPPGCTAIGPDNKLVLAPGLLGGTNAANSGRISVGGKSPLTGGIKEANSGGQAGQYLAKLGVAAIIVENAAEEGTYKLFVSQDKVELSRADDLAGLGNYETMAKLTAQYGNKVGLASVGPAGEMRLAGASVAFSDREMRPARHAGRGGLGAVMGSKGLKAIVIDPAGAKTAPIADTEKFKAATKRFAEALRTHAVTSGGLPEYGTNILTNILSEAGGLPTRNFSAGSFEGAEATSGEKLNALTKARNGIVSHGCMTGCMIRCSGVYNDEQGNFVSKWPEYETVWAFGADCGIDDLDAIARYDYVCDDVGVDTIETGNAVAVAMEGGVLQFGDAAGAEKLLLEIGQKTPLGRLIGSGAAAVGRAFGVRRVPVVKNQAMPAYDPRSVKGIGVTYATTPMGADHTAGYSVMANILGVGGTVDPLKPEGQVELSRNLQIATAAIDSLGLCLFVTFPVLDIPDAAAAMTDMVNAKYGWDLSDLSQMGTDCLKAELDFNRRAGFTPADDRLPDWMSTEQLPPHNTVWDVEDKELDKALKF